MAKKPVFYAWGANSYGQLSLGYACEMVGQPQPVDFEAESVAGLCGGGGHSMLLDTRGRLWSCGWNSRGQLGLGHRKNEHLFQEVPFPSKQKVVRVECGWDFSLAITEEGQVWGCGSNVFGQLGLGEDCKGIDGFVPIPHLPVPMKDIACGLRHSLFVSNEGKVFGCGSSKKGQLGGEVASHFVECVSVKETDKVKVDKVLAGQHCSLFVAAEEGNKTLLFGVGDIKSTELKQENEDGSFTIANDEWSAPIEHVSSGWTHTAITLEDRTAICFGRNDYFQLGRNDPGSLQKLVIPFKTVKAGSEHCLALNSYNQLMSWGWNEHGSCGVRSSGNVPEPTPVQFPKPYTNVIEFCPASGHNFAVISEIVN